MSDAASESGDGGAGAPLKPIYLFADSQPLFWRGADGLFLETVGRQIGAPSAGAAYLGASNGDNPEFYSIFVAAMEGIGVRDCRMIPSRPGPQDVAFLEGAGLILLAGGDVERGWQVFTENGLKDLIVRRYQGGAVLAGVSAGAVQLGLFGWTEPLLSSETLFTTFKLVPFVVGAHEEGSDWRTLRQAVSLLGGGVRGVGIPTGGGMIFHPDQTVEPVRFHLCEFVKENGEVTRRLLFPHGSPETASGEAVS